MSRPGRGERSGLPDSAAGRGAAPLGPGARGLAAAFAVSGVVHLVRPGVFEPIVPRVLPRRRELVLVSGVAELGCALGLVLPRSRRWAGVASSALLLAVYPANLQMAIDAARSHARHPEDPARVRRRLITLLRLPLQLMLLRWAWSATRR